MTEEKLQRDLKAYCQKNNHTTNAPSCEAFFKAMSYTSGVLPRAGILWSELIALIGLKTKRRCYTGRKINAYRRKGVEVSKNNVTSECQCGRIYSSPIDHKGVKINYRCDLCKQGQGSEGYYSGNMGEALYNVVPKEKIGE